MAEPACATYGNESGTLECVSVQAARQCVNTGDEQKDKCVIVQGKCVPVQQAILEAIELGNLAEVAEVQDPPKVALARALLAEAIGTGMIVLFGCGSVLSSLSGAYNGIWQVAIVWGFGVSLAIFCTAEASGAHLNPAVTLAFYLVRPQAHGMTALKALLYVAAQFLGAILCGFINLAVYSTTIDAFERKNNITRGDPASIKTASGFGEYFPNPGLSVDWGNGHYKEDDVHPLQACLVEAWGTFILCFVIFSITNSRNKSLGIESRPGAPFMIGATVSVLLALYAPITQAGWNPARDFGPRLVAAVSGWGKVAIPGPRNGFWVYIVGPCIGGPIGAFFAEKVLWRKAPRA